MRHLGSIVLSLLLGPLVYALCGVGLVKTSAAERSAAETHVMAMSIGLAALLAAGLLYTPLVMARLSPLGPVLIGSGYLAMTGWVVGARASFTRTIPVDALGVRGAAWAPAGAVTALLAVPLLATIVSPRRWRRWGNAPARVAEGYPPEEYPAYQGGPSYPETPTYSAAPAYPTYPAPTSGAPTPAYGGSHAPTDDDDEASEETRVLPSPGSPIRAAERATAQQSPAPATPAKKPSTAPPVWPVLDDATDQEVTRKLP